MDNNTQNSFERELERRLGIMEAPDYEAAPCFNKTDYIITAAVILICIAAVIGGAIL